MERRKKTDSTKDMLMKYGPILLILIPIFLSIFFRVQPAYLPITDDWAESSVTSSFKNQVAQQVERQYPNLPDANKQVLIQSEYDKFLEKNQDMVDNQIQQTSEHFKSKMKDEDGQTYLLAIDPWLWLGYAENYVENGHMGDTVVDGQSYYSLRNGRELEITGIRLYALLEAQLYNFMNIFTDTTVMQAAFYLPLVLTTIAVIAMFVAGWQVGGAFTATFASIVLAMHTGLLTRTVAGFSDTDNLIVFGEMISIMFFFLALNARERKWSLIYGALSGLGLAIYANGHSSWYHIFDFLIGATAVYALYIIWQNKYKIKDIINTKNWTELGIFNVLSFVVTFFAGFSLLRIIIGKDPNIISTILTPITGPLQFMTSKSVGVTSLWPNVLTTVAERNTIALGKIIGQIGGEILFLISIVGIVLMLWRREKKMHVFTGVFLIFWYIGAIYAASDSIRFVALLVPPFAIAVTEIFRFIYTRGADWFQKNYKINRNIMKGVTVLLLLVVVIIPLGQSAMNTAEREVPSMNDAWYDSLTGIKEDSTDAIITSWWDFGHWFVTVADRRVTFDGGDQGERIHWVGKSLLTDNETLSVGTLRMLNCGQEKAPHVLEGYLNNDTVRAIELLDEMTVEDREGAREILEEEGLSESAIEDVLAVTHCEDLIKQYYIVSDDMVGKAGVWGHFGSWDFERASMFNKVHNKNQAEGMQILTDDFGLRENEANSIYYEIQTEEADMWIAPWPSYMRQSNCQVRGDQVQCGNGLVVNMTDYDARMVTNQGSGRPNSLVYLDGDLKEKEFSNGIGISAALIPKGNSYQSVLFDPLQTKSMFMRLYFYEGHGSECFDLLSHKQSFTGNQIYVYNVDWNCSSVREVYSDEEITASHILISTDNRTDEEALELAEQVKGMLNSTNFAEIASEYSEGPSAANGGELGSFGKGQMVAPFEDAAFDLEVGDVSEPVKTQFGYHIIKRTG